MRARRTPVDKAVKTVDNSYSRWISGVLISPRKVDFWPISTRLSQPTGASRIDLAFFLKYPQDTE